MRPKYMALKPDSGDAIIEPWNTEWPAGAEERRSQRRLGRHY
jgi:hypothetical protein